MVRYDIGSSTIMTEQEIKKLIDKYLNGSANEDEIQLLEDFLWSYQHKSSASKSTVEPDREKKSEALFKKIQAQVKPKRGRNISFSIHLKVAAVIIMLLIAGLAFFMSNHSNGESDMITRSTLRGQKSNIVLSDGTRVKLNAESSVTYPKQFTKETREVVLKGEAFFDVVRNETKPFIVHANNLKTTVLGTSFNIAAFSNHNINITVATGRVKVETTRDTLLAQSVLLTPAEQATFDITAGKLSAKKVDLEQILSWKDGILRFEKISFEEAARVLERWYNVTIQFENEALKRCVLRGKYKDENLVNVLESLKFLQGIEYRFGDNNQVFISGNGCQTKKITE